MQGLRIIVAYRLAKTRSQATPGLAFSLLMIHLLSYSTKLQTIHDQAYLPHPTVRRKLDSTGEVSAVYQHDTIIRHLSAATVGRWVSALERELRSQLGRILGGAKGSPPLEYVLPPPQHLWRADSFQFVPMKGWRCTDQNEWVPPDGWADTYKQQWAAAESQLWSMLTTLLAAIFLCVYGCPRGVEMGDALNPAAPNAASSPLRWSHVEGEMLLRLKVKKDSSIGPRGVERGLPFAFAYILLRVYEVFGQPSKQHMRPQHTGSNMAAHISRVAGFNISIESCRVLSTHLVMSAPEEILEGPQKAILGAAASLYGHSLYTHWKQHYAWLLNPDGSVNTEKLAVAGGRLFRQSMLLDHLDIPRTAQVQDEFRESIFQQLKATDALQKTCQFLRRHHFDMIAHGLRRFIDSEALLYVLGAPCASGKTMFPVSLAAAVSLLNKPGDTVPLIYMMAPTKLLTASLRESWAVRLPTPSPTPSHTHTHPPPPFLPSPRARALMC